MMKTPGDGKKNLIAAISLFLLMIAHNTTLAQQQSFTFVQYMDNLTPINPAYSLLDKAGSISIQGRKQWVGVNGAPTSFQFNGNLPIESIGAATGLMVFNDQFAIEHEIEANAYFAKSVQLAENSYLSVSINAGVRNYTSNYSSLDASDPSFKNDVRETKPNIGFGIMYFSDWYYLGISAPELTITSLGTASVQNNVNFKNHYYFSAAMLTNLGTDIKFKPAGLLSYVPGIPVTADISGTIYMKEILGLGFNYRTNNEAAGIITLNVDTFHIGYSYQFGTSSYNLGGFNNATHEITIALRFGKGSTTSKLL
jgi:type IX secretion system PorP/SprF family membrane protein